LGKESHIGIDLIITDLSGKENERRVKKKKKTDFREGGGNYLEGEWGKGRPNLGMLAT
jgi:hypothetical protein